MVNSPGLSSRSIGSLSTAARSASSLVFTCHEVSTAEFAVIPRRRIHSCILRCSSSGIVVAAARHCSLFNVSSLANLPTTLAGSSYGDLGNPIGSSNLKSFSLAISRAFLSGRASFDTRSHSCSDTNVFTSCTIASATSCFCCSGLGGSSSSSSRLATDASARCIKNAINHEYFSDMLSCPTSRSSARSASSSSCVGQSCFSSFSRSA